MFITDLCSALHNGMWLIGICASFEDGRHIGAWGTQPYGYMDYLLMVPKLQTIGRGIRLV